MVGCPDQPSGSFKSSDSLNHFKIKSSTQAMKFTQPFDMSFTAKALALLFFLSTAIGAYCHHTSIPFWDMWNGYVEFGVRMLDGHWSSLWDQHNEHRITVSRLLFLIDLFAFKGNSRFLIIANVLLLAVSAWTFFSIARSDLGDNHNVALPYLLVAWMFSWCQSDNIVWAFQSQFILAQIAPLWSLLLLHFGCSLFLDHGQWRADTAMHDDFPAAHQGHWHKNTDPDCAVRGQCNLVFPRLYKAGSHRHWPHRSASVRTQP
jgi:hypothetical protein